VVLFAIIVVSVATIFVSCFKQYVNSEEKEIPTEIPSKWPERFKMLGLLLFFSRKTRQTRGIISGQSELASRQKEEEVVEEKILDEIFPVEDEKVEVMPKKDVAPTLFGKNYKFPPLSLLEKSEKIQLNSKARVQENKERVKLLEEALISFNVDAKVVNITSGPSVTRFELKPGMGVKISKITSLSNDIALMLSAHDIRIEAPIPGKALIGIEVPNANTDSVNLRTIMDEKGVMAGPSKLLGAMGLTITGESVAMDLAKMPHVLIAGATGSGKSVCVNAIIMSILMRATPDEVKFLMIDPKKVELAMYEGIPHLVAPVVTNPSKAAATLKKWALVEMERRYEHFAKSGVKDIDGYNTKVEAVREEYGDKENQLPADIDNYYFPDTHDQEVDSLPPKLPYIVVIIDELADLMMVASQEVENTICRLAQMARATGIHLVIATQRPSVDVVTGLIKANVPSRISFFLQSQIDSRTILDMPGAEKLLGKGDMLYAPVGTFKPKRLQGVFVSQKEIKAVVAHCKKQGGPNYSSEIMEVEPLKEDSKSRSGANDQDALFEDAKKLVQSTEYASTSYLQRKLRVGYNRAARIMDELEAAGVVIQDGDKRRVRNPQAPA